MSIDRALLGLLTTEARVLLTSAAGSEYDDELRGLLAQPLDWTRLAWQAEWERATSVLWRRVMRLGRDRVPAEIAEALQRLTMFGDFRAVYLKERTDAILDTLRREQIEVVLLKGAALLHGPYAAATDRPMGDVDILVPPDRAQDVWRIAMGQGWQWNSQAFPWSRYEGHHHLPPLFDEQPTGLKLEVHTALCVEGHPFSLEFSEARAGSRRLSAPLDHVLVLENDLLLVHLAVHFAWSHEMLLGGWRVFRDIWALAGSGRVDWDRVISLAQRHQATSCCHWTFRLARALTGAPIPDGVLDRLPIDTPRALRRLLDRHFALHMFTMERQCPSVSVRRKMWTWAIGPESIGQKLRPWDAVDHEMARHTAPPAVTSRLNYHLHNAVRWWNYLRLVAVSR